MNRSQNGAGKKKQDQGQTKLPQYFSKTPRNSMTEPEKPQHHQQVAGNVSATNIAPSPVTAPPDELATVRKENVRGDANRKPRNQRAARTAPALYPAAAPPTPQSNLSKTTAMKTTPDNSRRQLPTTSPSEGDMSKPCSETRMKLIKPEEPEVGHEHKINFKFKSQDKVYPFICLCPCTVQQAFVSATAEKTGSNVVIQRRRGDVIASHFPCHLIEHEEVLNICRSRVEESTTVDLQVDPKEKCITFTIGAKGGKDTKSKNVVKSKYLKRNFGALCVYGVCGETIAEAIQRDGRFLDIVTETGSYLSESDTATDTEIKMNQVVNGLKDGKYKIRLEKQKKGDTKTGAFSDQTGTIESGGRDRSRLKTSTAKQAAQRNEARKVYNKYTPLTDNGEVLQILRDQFEDLKKRMESREASRENSKTFPELLSLKRKNFGKIRQIFSEVHRVRNFMELANSVCIVDVEGVITGTGFVLFDNFILTNAHLFSKSNVKMQLVVNVSVIFNYENLNVADSYVVKAKNRLIDYQIDPDENKNALDYAILELDPETANPHKKIPPGLLCKYGPVPDSGEACLIGHPDSSIKQMDPTCIIDDIAREQINYLFMMSANDIYLDGVVPYNTYFAEGASGSPIFDVSGKVFGLHTAGYSYMLDEATIVCFQYAHPLEVIINSFARRLKENRNVWNRIMKQSKDNLTLRYLLEAAKRSDDEPMHQS